MLFGSAMHAAVKEAVAALASRPEGKTHGTRSVPWLPNREELRAILSRHWPAAGFPDPLQERRYREEGLRQLEGACRTWAAEPFELLHQEKRFEFEWGGTTLNGRMDQINRTSRGDLELIEYKTGTPQTQKDADRSPQLTLYAEACRRVVGRAPGGLVLFNLATGERVRTARTPEQLQAFERLIRQTAAAMQAGRFPARPGFLCRYCDFRPICPAHEESDPGSTI
jgi:RecB family exonuclease